MLVFVWRLPLRHHSGRGRRQLRAHDPAAIRAIAERKPERVVLLDEGFAGNDQLKANAVQIFKTKGITSFKTVCQWRD